MKNYKIAVAGTGYVGLSLGVLLSQHHQVVAVDIVQAKVDMMAGFVLKNTLSDNGGVTRGICKMDENGNLTEVVETKNIVKTADTSRALAFPLRMEASMV